MVWIDKKRIPKGNWPFLGAAREGLARIESELEPDIDLSEGNSGITITGCMRAYRQAVMRRVLDLANSTVTTWNGGYLVGSIVSARALLETVATHHSFLTRAEILASKKQWKEIGDLVDAYAFSTTQNGDKKSSKEFDPPRVGRAVKDFIESSEPGKKEFWDQISNTSHPNGTEMMKYAGVLKDGHFHFRGHSENEAYYFPAIFNALYSCCWLIGSDLEFDILLAVIRNGDELPRNHPLIEKRRLIDEVAGKLSREFGPIGNKP